MFYRDEQTEEARRAISSGVFLVVLMIVLFCIARAKGQAVAPPQGVPVTARHVDLGKKLFFDPRLSSNGTISCATCHNPKHGWADPFPKALGLVVARNGSTVARPEGTLNSPTVLEKFHSPTGFHNGRVNGRVAPTGTSMLAEQALLPLANPIEMGQQSVDDVLRRLRRIPGYVRLFLDAYGPKADGASVIDRSRLGHALASFECTLTSRGAPVDYRLAGDTRALTPRQEIGFGLMLKANCFSCHQPPDMSTWGFANNGMLFFAHTEVTNPRLLDDGRASAPGVQRVKGTIRAQKVETLREVHRTAPYAADGSLANLATVVEHYSRGGFRADGQRDPQIDDRIVPQNWNEDQKMAVRDALENIFASPNYPHMEAPLLP